MNLNGNFGSYLDDPIVSFAFPNHSSAPAYYVDRKTFGEIGTRGDVKKNRVTEEFGESGKSKKIWQWTISGETHEFIQFRKFKTLGKILCIVKVGPENYYFP